jgi:hypothetical protein
MLPFHMLAALPTQPSFGLDPIVPLFPPLFSVTSALKIPTQPHRRLLPIRINPTASLFFHTQ